ncbi:sugar phosphate isomerase/epimerase family protein [Salinicoccus roseus]|uniref:Sugar phosphate isomerase/epimerase n=1 Tax=Salinicoccus roseus TaxID=45670 RepID=A0A0C2HHX3_9STAP|nr:sugar phosphate isomerase/epimerase [Salinicoccus roseus]KIH71249.1 xylose isomerase [Salinicoccus roseus]MDB0579980.1 sugar phosphate isomerase/epimerase [Salinicoccus roseus]
MKLGVFNPLFQNMRLEEMLDYIKASGLDAVEIGTGGYPGDKHCNVDELLESKDAREAYLEKFTSRGLIISAFSCHGNPISPDEAFRRESDEILRKSIRLANLMDVPVVNTFSGTPAGNETDTAVNWPVTPWPEEYSEIKEWQWKNRLIPYWQDIAELAKENDVKIGLELHGGFLVHSPHTMLELRKATNAYIGANLDPSHMWWQGIDPVAAIKILGREEALHHFHAKDTYIDQDNLNMHGYLDMNPYGNIRDRSWTFRSVGLGHSVDEWANMMSALRTYDYDYVVSIEHEDGLMSIEEGFQTAVRNLQGVIIKEQPTDMWWA